MKIQLVGFDFCLNPNDRLDIVKEVINRSEADLILFPGHTLRDEDDIYYLSNKLTNIKSVVVLELEEADPTSCMHTRNELYIYRDGAFSDLYSSQIFSTADDIIGNEVLMEKFFDELFRRTLECCGKMITVLQCGETALLASSKADRYKASFRFKNNDKLNRRYEQMLNSTDIFLNPIHDLQGEQGVMAQRRITLSADGRYYFSTCALNEEMANNFSSKRLQYAYFNSAALSSEPYVNSELGYVSRVFEID